MSKDRELKERMYQRSISEPEVRHVIATGERVEDYPDDTPYPSRLVLGWQPTTASVVVPITRYDKENIVITVYERI